MKTPLTQSLTTLAPIGVLGVVLVLLLFAPIPGANKDVVISIVSGLLGFMAKGERSSSTAGAPSAGGDPSGTAGE